MIHFGIWLPLKQNRAEHSSNTICITTAGCEFSIRISVQLGTYRLWQHLLVFPVIARLLLTKIYMYTHTQFSYNFQCRIFTENNSGKQLGSGGNKIKTAVNHWTHWKHSSNYNSQRRQGGACSLCGRMLMYASVCVCVSVTWSMAPAYVEAKEQTIVEPRRWRRAN